MAITVAKYASGRKPLHVFGEPKDKLTVMFLTVALDSSYPTGGESLDLSMHFSSIKGVCIMNAPLSYFFKYDVTNKKLLAYYEDQTSGVHAQVANTTDLSAITDLCLMVVGEVQAEAE